MYFARLSNGTVTSVCRCEKDQGHVTVTEAWDCVQDQLKRFADPRICPFLVKGVIGGSVTDRHGTLYRREGEVVGFDPTIEQILGKLV